MSQKHCLIRNTRGSSFCPHSVRAKIWFLEIQKALTRKSESGLPHSLVYRLPNCPAGVAAGRWAA